MRRKLSRCAALVATLLVPGLSAAAGAQTVEAPFDTDYSTVDLGSPPDVFGNLGGLTIKALQPGKLLIGYGANTGDGKLYEVELVRDLTGHITGFGDATEYADAADNDGGVAYGPQNVLFLARFPDGDLGQYKPGSTAPDKIIDLNAAPYNLSGSPGAVQFVPDGFPGAGSLKIASYSDGTWYDSGVTADGSGTFNLTGFANVPDSTLATGPEGIVYIAAGQPQFGAPSMLVSEWNLGRVSAYTLDADGNPVVDSQRDFITGLSGAEGATIDPVTGDFLFSTYGGGNRVIAVQGFAPDPCAQAGVITDNDGTDTDPAAGRVAGTAGDDVICGSSAGDRLYGRGGSDTLYGLGGADRLYGETGDDTLFGGDKGDILLGGTGGDLYSGGTGVDMVRYGNSVTEPITVDMASANGGDDGRAGEGDDVGDDIERLEGGRAGDTIKGNALNNTIFGGAGADALRGGAKHDSLYGEEGYDTITSSEDNPTRDGVDCGADGGIAFADASDDVTNCDFPI